jgi:glycosyltransferase involved in cell wall biosynthesis
MQKYGGVTKYFCELIKNLPEEHEFQLSILFSDNQYLKENRKKFGTINLPLPDIDYRLKLMIKKMIYKINQSYSNHILRKNQFDIFHPTYFHPYFLNNFKKPYIVTVHDLIQFKFKHLYINDPSSYQMEKVIKNANRLISISENTKKDLIEIFNIRPEKIDVIYHGYSKGPSVIKPNNFGRYILFVGRRGGYKNFTTFVKAASALLNKQKDLRLVCAGDPFKKDELNLLQTLKISEQCFTIGASEDKLNNLYANALAFVYPTLYEGFGMPILEAFANNCPACLSNTSSLPEIAGNAAIYFDPENEESILYAIQKVIFDQEYSKLLVDLSKERLKLFSWEKCAKQTVGSYHAASAS